MRPQVPGFVPQDDIVNVDEPQEVGCNAGFLGHLTAGSISGPLTGLDVTAGQAPDAADRGLPPFDEQHVVAAENDGARRGFRPDLPRAPSTFVSAHGGDL